MISYIITTVPSSNHTIKASLNSSREVAQDSRVDFINYFYLILLIKGQNELQCIILLGHVSPRSDEGARWGPRGRQQDPARGDLATPARAVARGSVAGLARVAVWQKRWAPGGGGLRRAPPLERVGGVSGRTVRIVRDRRKRRTKPKER